MNASEMLASGTEIYLQCLSEYEDVRHMKVRSMICSCLSVSFIQDRLMISSRRIT